MKDKVLIKSFPSGITIYLDNEVSFDEINRICGWSADEHGLDGRRRKFISNIRQLLKDDETLVIRSLVDVKVDAYKLEYSK